MARYNYKYAKLVDGQPVYAPHPLILTDGRQMFTTDPTVYLAAGYKQITTVTMPEQEGYYATVGAWQEDATTVWRGWELVAIPAEDTPTDPDA